MAAALRDGDGGSGQPQPPRPLPLTSQGPGDQPVVLPAAQGVFCSWSELQGGSEYQLLAEDGGISESSFGPSAVGQTVYCLWSPDHLQD